MKENKPKFSHKAETWIREKAVAEDWIWNYMAVYDLSIDFIR